MRVRRRGSVLRAVGTVLLSTAGIAGAALQAQACDLTQVQTLAPNPAEGDISFGVVAMSGGWLVAGAARDDTVGSNAGAVHFYRKEGGAWVYDSRLAGSQARPGDMVGVRVDVDGSVAVANSNVDGRPVYVFRHDGTAWREEAVLFPPPEVQANDNFGVDVAVKGDLLVIGAHAWWTYGGRPGAAYVYRHEAGNWRYEARLAASNSQAGNVFGMAVETDGERIVVGAPQAQFDDRYGAAYVFRQEEGEWVEEALLAAADQRRNNEFGFSVAIDGDRVAVGAARDSEAGQDAGATYVFRRSNTVWNQEAKLLSGDLSAVDVFGVNVALAGDWLAAAAQQQDMSVTDDGAVYLFHREGGTWSQVARLFAADPLPVEALGGYGVAMAGTEVAAGAQPAAGNSGRVLVFDFRDSDQDGVPDGCETVVGGSVTGLDGRTATCRNETTGQMFTFRLEGATAWDCEARGLKVQPGDRIRTGVSGVAR